MCSAKLSAATLLLYFTLLKEIMNFYPYLSHSLTALGENLKYNFRVMPSVQQL